MSVKFNSLLLVIAVFLSGCTGILDVDDDDDGFIDTMDKFPNDPNEWSDNDDDGVGDNSDQDDDDDGFSVYPNH
jgi:hypothetical protein